MAVEVYDNDRLKIQLAQHFRENWKYYKDMKPVLASRYMAALAIDFIQVRCGGTLPG